MSDPSRAELLVAAAIRFIDASGIELARTAACELDRMAKDPQEFNIWRCDIEAARALLGDGWQPIETAPKDGTTIILWSSYMDEPCTGAWGRQRFGEGWIARHEGQSVIESEHEVSGTDYKTISVVTHWRPLPAPPVGEG